MDRKDKKFKYLSGAKFPKKKKLVPKCQSIINFFQNTSPELLGNSNNFKNFSANFERLDLEHEELPEEISEENEEVVLRELSLSPQQEDVEPCMCEECLKQESKLPGIKTREISSFRLVVQGPEILNYQGIRYSLADIAPYWKKDARMWLWKSVRLAHKQKSKSKSFSRFPLFSRALKGS